MKFFLKSMDGAGHVPAPVEVAAGDVPLVGDGEDRGDAVTLLGLVAQVRQRGVDVRPPFLARRWAFGQAAVQSRLEALATTLICLAIL